MFFYLLAFNVVYDTNLLLPFQFVLLSTDVVVSDGRYMEPSIRPDDSRYGENPNRLQRHTQFQASCHLPY